MSIQSPDTIPTVPILVTACTYFFPTLTMQRVRQRSHTTSPTHWLPQWLTWEIRKPVSGPSSGPGLPPFNRGEQSPSPGNNDDPCSAAFNRGRQETPMSHPTAVQHAGVQATGKPERSSERPSTGQPTFPGKAQPQGLKMNPPGQTRGTPPNTVCGSTSRQ